MSEWWTYTLADFLLFSPRTYHRLFALHNAAWWPLQIPALAGGCVIGAALYRGTGRRIALGVLAAAWAFVAWAFHLERYATINWAATWFAAGFALQAALLLVAAWRLPIDGDASPARRRVGLVLVGLALIGMPLLAAASGRPWAQAEVFGLMPDPNVLATLGVLLMLPRSVWWLWPVPLLWCAAGGATLWAMDEPAALVLPVAGVLALVLRAALRTAARQ